MSVRSVVRSTGQQWQRGIEPGQDLVRSKERAAGSRQLDRQGQTIEPATDGGNSRSVPGAK
jgi:hypothetical protein